MQFFLFLFLGFVIALYSSWKIARERLYHERVIFDAVILTAFSSLLASRITYILLHVNQFGFNVLKWLLFGKYPGFSASGSFVGAALVMWILSDKKTRVSFPELVDVIAFSFRNALFILIVGALALHYQVQWLAYTIQLVGCSLVLVLFTFLQRRNVSFTAGTQSAVYWLLVMAIFFSAGFAQKNSGRFNSLTADQWIYAVFILLLGIIIGFQFHQKRLFKKR